MNGNMIVQSSDPYVYQDIVMGHVGNQFGNESDLVIYILEAESVIIPKLLKLSKQVQMIVFMVIWSLILIGSYFKAVLYKYLYEKYTSKSFNNIDTLILVESIVRHVQVILSGTVLTILFLNDSLLLEDFGGNIFCATFHYYIIFGYTYSFISGLVISIYRILLIKKSLWVQYKIGEKNLIKVIAFGGIILANLWAPTTYI